VRAILRLLVAGMLVAVLPFTSASAAPDRTVNVVAGTPSTWDGVTATGTAFENFIGAQNVNGVQVTDGLQCSKNPDSYCETILVGFDLTLTQEEIDAGKIRKRANGEIAIGEPTVPAYDFDLIVYDSDANGTKGALLGQSGALDETPGEEAFALSGITGTIAAPIKYYLVEVVYFYAVQGSYKGTARMTSTPKAS
jgi:hypothetical protein